MIFDFTMAIQQFFEIQYIVLRLKKRKISNTLTQNVFVSCLWNDSRDLIISLMLIAFVVSINDKIINQEIHVLGAVMIYDLIIFYKWAWYLNNHKAIHCLIIKRFQH